jgi:UDP-2,3-diacylglucosamine pyrophosphatase LpxH
MNVTDRGNTAQKPWSRHLETIQQKLRILAHQRLSQVFETAVQVLFDDTSRFVFFSDCHRGTNGRTDAFARNETLFTHALQYYLRQAFTYVEVGDGDELWQNRRFSDVQRAHEKVFDLLHQFDRRSRLQLVLGNHDLQGRRRDRVEKDGLVAREGLVLQHARTRQQVFVVHGHQADFFSDGLRTTSRLAVRHVWKRLQVLGLVHARFSENRTRSQRTIEGRITAWVQARRQVVICGHTHRAASPSQDAAPYFNTGSCLRPGVLTGIEICEGAIALVRWTLGLDDQEDSAPLIRRELLTVPRPLRAFG